MLLIINLLLILLGLPCYFFSCCFWDFLLIFDFQHFDYDVSGCETICIYPTCHLLSLVGVHINVFIKFGKFLVIIPSKKKCAHLFVFSFWYSYYVYVGSVYWCSKFLWGYFSQLFFFFLCVKVCMISIVLCLCSLIFRSIVELS